MMYGRFRHLKPEFQLIDFCIPGFRHESSTMRFKGQFSQPVVQGGIHMPATSHAAPTCIRQTTPVRSSVGGACVLRLHFCDKPPGLGTPPLIRIEDQWTAFPAAMDLKRVAATRDNGLRANCRCPALATVLATEVHQGRTPRDMLQGRCRPHPPPSHTIRRMVSNPCRYAVGTTGCWGDEAQHVLDAADRHCCRPTVPVRDRFMHRTVVDHHEKGLVVRCMPANARPSERDTWVGHAARRGVPDARSMCALA